MEKAKISLLQLYVMMVLFGLGSSSILGIGAKAKQDAWIVILLGMIGGIILILLYGYIFKKSPDNTYLDTLQKIVGPFFGRILGMLYVLYFLYIATLVLRDITELLLLYILPETPMVVLGGLTMAVTLYAIYLGIEAISRFTQIDFIFAVPLKILFVFGPILTGIAQFDNLKPVLENGWKPVLSTAFPLVSSFPFGEMIVFLMLFPYVNNKEKTTRTGIFAILTIGIVLMLITISNLITLGPLMTELTFFPTIQTARMINIMEFIQRVEGLAVIVFLTCSFVKVTIYAYAASIGLNVLFKTKTHRKYIIPTVIIILIGSIYNADNITRHLYIGLRIVPMYVNFPFDVIIPIILIMIISIKKLFNKKYA